MVYSKERTQFLQIFLLLGLLFRQSPTFREHEYTVPAKIVVASLALVALTFVPSYAYSILASNSFVSTMVFETAHVTRFWLNKSCNECRQALIHGRISGFLRPQNHDVIMRDVVVEGSVKFPLPGVL